MTANINQIRSLLQRFEFQKLFIEELGWDSLSLPLMVTVDGASYALHPIAEKRGLVVYACSLPQIPKYPQRKRIESEVKKFHREHILIFTDEAHTAQIWQWVRREPGKPQAGREVAWQKGQQGDGVVQRLLYLYIDLDDEDTLTGLDVQHRTRRAFDLERVTKRFYDRFKTEHQAFLQGITGIIDDEMQRWYASVMLNRLMFIYFIQKKGFLDSNPDYLPQKLEQSKVTAPDRYYKDFLCPLFFEGFAKKPESRTAAIRKLLGTIPYLNGGLFLPHQVEELYGQSITIQDAAFERIFEFFEQYQWHLDERPLRRDDEINPDVLGYIFEKYINQKQMGAYYTKEDITAYISKNTIIPFLFETAAQSCKIAFSGPASMWRLVQENPERYIYEAVKHGVGLELPPDIEAGIKDVSHRSGWNKSAPEDYALPTEIWREVVERRQRFADIKAKAKAGEITSIQDFITYNLDIVQFAQDVIESCEGPELLRAFYKAIREVTVLDPTCGSGAFLFAALHILKPLYEACLERMQAFLNEQELTEPKAPASKFKDFREELARIAQHPSHDYYVLKTIILNNLYGVDIMEEATEICKLRLFLKLVAQVRQVQDIEPLPDIDFNIRAGNTLVGFATLDEAKKTIGKKIDFTNALTKIEEKAEDVETLFKLFREQQTNKGGEVTLDEKNELKRRLAELEEELNRYLADEYGVDLDNVDAYRQWKHSHKPFHWFVDFYRIIKQGGFDVVIGNPPYVEYRLVQGIYKLQSNLYQSENSKNLYAFSMERACSLLHKQGLFSMIVPSGLLGLDETTSIRDVLFNRFTGHYCSTYAIRPSKLFDGVDQRLCIYLGNIAKKESFLYTTRYHHWNSDERSFLFCKLIYISSFIHPRLNRICQVGSKEAYHVLQKLESFAFKLGAHYYAPNHSGYLMHYHRSPRYWIRATDFEQYFKSATRARSIHHFRDLYFDDKTSAKIVGSLINSSLFFFWFISVGNGRNVTGTDIEKFALGDLKGKITVEMPVIFNNLMDDYQKNSFIRVRQDCEFQEFKPSHSKPIIDQIDRVLAQHYGFTDEELDFIINYDIKYRLGRDSGDDVE